MESIDYRYFSVFGPLLIAIIVAFPTGRKCARMFDGDGPWLSSMSWFVAVSTLCLWVTCVVHVEVDARRQVARQLQPDQAEKRYPLEQQARWRITEIRRLGPVTLECFAVLDLPTGYQSGDEVKIQIVRLDVWNDWLLPLLVGEGTVLSSFAVGMYSASKWRQKVN